MDVDELAEMSQAESDAWIDNLDNTDRVREMVAEDIENTIADLSRDELRELLTDAILHGTTVFHTGRMGPMSEL